MPQVEFDKEGCPVPDGSITIVLTDGSTEEHMFKDIQHHGPQSHGWVVFYKDHREDYSWHQTIRTFLKYNSEDYGFALGMYQETHEHAWEFAPPDPFFPGHRQKYCNGCLKSEIEHEHVVEE